MIYRPSALKSLRKIRLFITIIYCSDLLCFLIVQFTKKIPLLPFVFISRLWKISHINLQKSFPCYFIVLISRLWKKYLTLILQKSFPRDFSINQLGGNVEIPHKSSNSQVVSEQKITEK